MKYSEQDVMRAYEESKSIAIDLLKTIPVFVGDEPKFGSLNGWIFEKCIQKCLLDELLEFDIATKIEEQPKIGKRRKGDLKINQVIVEIKLYGFYTRVEENEKRLKLILDACNQQNLIYLYITGYESYEPYMKLTKTVIGEQNSFFLQSKAGYVQGEWKRFVSRIAELVR